jgi:hypothetical protein
VKSFDPHVGETTTLGPEGPRATSWLLHDEVDFVWHPCRWYLALGGACANVMPWLPRVALRLTRVALRLSGVIQTLPGVAQMFCGVAQTLPEAVQTLPGITQTLPRIA